MARIEAQAVAQYFKTPSHLLADIARLVCVPSGEGRSVWDMPSVSVVDPCAGDGEALCALVDAFEKWHVKVRPFACELEHTRYTALAARDGINDHGYYKNVVHGDASMVLYTPHSDAQGASVLFLNPPYDEQVKPRPEVAFLERWTRALAPDGVLLYVVPYHALKLAAPVLAQCYRALRCFRFPDADFTAFKQVLLCGVRAVDLAEPDSQLVEVLRGWSSDPTTIDAWDAIEDDLYAAPRGAGFSKWSIAELDVCGLLENFKPWHRTVRGGVLEPIAGMVQRAKGAALLTRRFPVAMPLKPAYVAAAVACGVFDGERLAPSDPASGLPDAIAKGTFARDFTTIDDRFDKDGDKVGEVQVQVPELEITVLDLRAATYHTLPSSADRVSSTVLADMTAADFIDAYWRDLTRVMKKNCPVLHDPERDGEDVQLAPLRRPLYAAQAHAARASVKLISSQYAGLRREWDPEGAGKRQNVLGLGELGSGKTSCSLAIAATLGVRSVLVICPPHLVGGMWPGEVRAVLGDATAHELRVPADVEAFAAMCRADKRDGVPTMRVGVMSREAAKLGHGYGELLPPEEIPDDTSLREVARLMGACPKCGDLLPWDDDKKGYAARRVRCMARQYTPKNTAARLADRLALLLAPALPGSENVRQLWRGRVAEIMRARPRIARAWHLVRVERCHALRQIVIDLLPLVLQGRRDPHSGASAEWALSGLLAAMQDHALTEMCVEDLLCSSDMRHVGKRLAMFLPSPMRARLAREYPDSSVRTVRWETVEEAAADFAKCVRPSYVFDRWGLEKGKLCFMGADVGSAELADAALRELGRLGKWSKSPRCGEPLFYAVGDPARVPLADWIVRRHKGLFKLIVRDESHEHSDADTAQTRASSKIMRLGAPCIDLTGSACGGYAESLFAGSHARDARFRLAFDVGEERAFVRRYGYVKRVVEDHDEKGKIVAFGSQSDKVVRTYRVSGNAPGVLPQFLLEWLLRNAFTIHKADLALDLPPHDEERLVLDTGAELGGHWANLVRATRNEIKRARFKKGKAGKLWGALVELVSYPDLAIEGVTMGERFEVRYPAEGEGKKRGRKGGGGGDLVCAAPLLPASTVTPKERLLLDTLEAELTAGHRVLVFTRHVALMPRLARIIERELKEPCVVLHSSGESARRKGERVVSALERQGWIEREVVAKRRRVLVVNPVAVKTGLNVLTWFDRAWWHELVLGDAITDRQANGRIDRPGKTAPTRALYPLYAGLQEKAFSLLKHKVAVSLAVDGLDCGSALTLAGIGVQGGFDAFSVGRQLFELMEKEDDTQ